MAHELTTKMKHVVCTAVCAAALAGPVHAQEAAPPEQAATAEGGVAATSSDTPWVKICNTDPNANKNVCLITQELRTETGQFLASVAIRETEGEQRRLVLTSVPVGMLIQPGLQLQVDSNEPVKANYSICFPNACYAELGLENDAFVNQLKAGGKLRVTALNQQAKPVRFEMTLIGFTDTYEGEGVNPQELQAQQEQLQQELNRKAEAARQRLIEAQREAEAAADEEAPAE